LKRGIQVTIGLLIGAVLVFIMFRNVDWAALFESLRNVSLTWFIIALIIVTLSFFFRVKRWTYLVRATLPDATYSNMFSATQIGFLANFTLPARAGEFIRPYVLARLEKTTFSKSLALTSLDRVTDLFGLIAVMIISGLAFQPKESVTIPKELLGRAYTITPQQLNTAALFPLIGSVLVIVAFVLLYLNTPMVLRISDAILGKVWRKAAEVVHGMLQSFSDGLHVFRSPWQMLKSVTWSIITWGVFVAGTASIMEAFHVDYPWYTPFVVQTTLAIAISLPGAPGFIGQFQAGMYAGLVVVLPTMRYEEALAIGLVTHVANIIPVAVIGVWCLAKENMSLLELREASREAEEELAEQPQE